MIANARWNPSVVDTLPKRVINGLEVILIRETYESGNIFWTLRVSDFKKCFQRFESKYPGGINYNFNSELIEKGCVTKGIIYGINSCGKSNLGLAIFDLITHLTEKEKLLRSYDFYLNNYAASDFIKENSQ